MRVIALALIGFVLLSSGVRAQGHNWDAVTALLRGSELAIVIEQQDGQQLLRGRLDSINDTQIVIISRWSYSLARPPFSERSVIVPRSVIRQVDWIITRRHWWQGQDDRAVVYHNPRHYGVTQDSLARGTCPGDG